MLLNLYLKFLFYLAGYLLILLRDLAVGYGISLRSGRHIFRHFTASATDALSNEGVNDYCYDNLEPT